MRHFFGTRRYLNTLFPIIIITLFIPSIGFSQTCEDWIAKVVSVQGQIFAQRDGNTEKVPVKLNDIYSAGDTIFVGQKSRLGVMLCNDALLRFDQNTTLTLSGIKKQAKGFKTILDLLKGAVHFFSRTPQGLTVATPYVNGSVEGTEFFVKVDLKEKQTSMSIFEGKVRAENAEGSILLISGESAIAKKVKTKKTKDKYELLAPQKVTVVRPRDAVQWALHYPPILSYRAKDFPGDTEWEEKIRQSIDFYWNGQLIDAFGALEGTSARIRDAKLFVYRAGLLLTVGRVDEAIPDIERALKLDPKIGEAVALQAVIAVVQNDKQKAMELAERAVVGMDAQSSVARVALSYAQQTSFDLEGARNSLEEATRLDGENAFAWARLSEIWQSLGYLDKSLTEAQKAISINPNLSRTQSVLGFAYLTQIKIKESMSAFERAILLDQAAPLPRLGLGLAKIRRGGLKDGRREIEIAAALDPNNSLIRSYLGKAYFEEKRSKLDQREFDIAKELDPNDPTPYFYDAIRLQSENRPVEALKNIQESIKKNDNRAVYRSRLLLDQDLAARSASLGRIYRDLGFEQLALVEGWKSVNTDPSNFSGHRFLADSYSTLPRHEIARVSELLQSQLLQPININPIQPSLAESDSLILSGAGPSDRAFNEFNPLFNRNRVALQANVVAGENSTVGNDLVISGVKDWFSISAGQNFYKTDGFRENNDLERQLYNVFTQASITPRTSIQAEYRYKDQEYGDLPLRFDPNNFLATERHEDRIGSIRLGFHHAFAPGSDLIGSFIYSNSDVSTVDTDSLFPINFQTEEDGYTGEVQHLLNLKWINIISGFGYFDSDTDDTISFLNLPPSSSKSNLQHTNIYAYSQIYYPSNVIWTLGGSGDFFRGLFVDTDQFNPKFGITWTPLQGTTLRGAVFRALKRSLIANQTIEPTQVAGFNQFFDDPDGVESWRYGVAWDQNLKFLKFSPFAESPIFSGLEFSKRELKIPRKIISPTDPIEVVRYADWDEYLMRVYAYWAPHEWIAFSAEYQYEKFDRDSEFLGLDLFKELKTHRLPLSGNFFHPSGLGAGLKATYIDQRGEFQNPDLSTASESDKFWLVDIVFTYRLPNRYGLISLEVKNLFDEEFRFQDTDASNPSIQPTRIVVGRIAFSF